MTRQLPDRIRLLGNEAVRLCLVRGHDRSALVEVGIAAAVPEVIAQLDGLGVSPDFLVVTHPHADHMTGLPGLKARFPAVQVVAATGAAAFARHPKMAEAMVREDAFMAARLVERSLAKDAICLGSSMSLDVDYEVADPAAPRHLLPR